MSKKYILTVETLTKSGSLSLFSEQFEKIDCFVGNEESKMSADIFKIIADLTDRNKVKLSQISNIVVSNGPGSFTGLRVGWAAVKGLAKGLNIPYSSVSSLDALFEQTTRTDIAFVSIGGGKIALKRSVVSSVEIMLNKEFLAETESLADKNFVTLKNFADLFPKNLPNILYASDNVSILIAKTFKKGIIDSNRLKYSG